jgi:hypothetical protein
MSKKEKYLESYAKGLEYGKDGIRGRVNKALDWVGFGGTQTEGEREGLEQGYKEMKEAQKAESFRDKVLSKVPKYSKGGTASARADGCAVKGKTKGKIV